MTRFDFLFYLNFLSLKEILKCFAKVSKTMKFIKLNILHQFIDAFLINNIVLHFFNFLIVFVIK